MSSSTQTTQCGQIIASCQGDYQRLIGLGSPNWNDWVDRVHGEVHRYSRWGWMLNIPQQFYTTIGQPYYFLGTGTTPGQGTITAIQITNNKATITRLGQILIGDGATVTTNVPAFTQLNGTWTITNSTPTTYSFNTSGLADVAFTLTSGTDTTVTNTGLGLTDLDIIKDGSVINRTTGLPIFKTGTAPYDVSGVWAVKAPPTRWLLRVNGVIELYSPPDAVYCIEFQYNATRKTITNTNDVVQIPDYYRSVIVAGVNKYAAAYLANDPNTGAAFRAQVEFWQIEYADGLRSMIRDKQNFPRTSYINPILP